MPQVQTLDWNSRYINYTTNHAASKVSGYFRYPRFFTPTDATGGARFFVA
jgi:hypothetical protein